MKTFLRDALGNAQAPGRGAVVIGVKLDGRVLFHLVERSQRQRASAGSKVIFSREPVAFARRSRAAVDGLT